MIVNETKQERAILVGVNLNNDPTFEHSLKELKELARACHMEVVCIHSQNLSTPMLPSTSAAESWKRSGKVLLSTKPIR